MKKVKNKIPKVARSMEVSAIEQRLKDILPPKRHETGSRQIMIVDGMGLAYQAKHAYARFSFSGKSTSLIFGIPMILKGLIKDHKPKKVIVAWDGKKAPERMKLLPTYKEHRNEKRDPEERARFIKDIERARKFLYYLGIPQAHDENIEGDDMVHLLTRYYQKIAKVLIVSGDKDFLQEVNYDVALYNPRTKFTQTTFAFIAEVGVEIPQFVDYLCLLGDDSDDIPGYRGVGPVTAKKFLRKYWSIKQYLDSNDEFPGLTDKDTLAEIYKRNRRLIDLKLFAKKYLGDKDFSFYRGKEMPSFNEEKFNFFCTKYGLKNFRLPEFINTFKNL